MNNQMMRNFEFELYKNALRNHVNKNKRFKVRNLKPVNNKPGVRVQLNGNNKTFINIEPVNNRSVYILYGKTNPNKRQQGFGTLLRKFIVNAANNTGKKVYQLSKNTENMMPKNSKNLHYSGRIMVKLGAKRIPYTNVPKSLTKGLPNNGLPWFLYTPKKR
jgi:hypothetical protein